MSLRRISVRVVVKKRAGGVCERCGKKLNRHKGKNLGSMHHRFKREYGGVDSAANLLYLCLRCHRSIHADEYGAGQEGFVVDYPEMTPVKLRGRGWVVLTSEGRFVYLSADQAQEIFDQLVHLPEHRREVRMAKPLAMVGVPVV